MFGLGFFEILFLMALALILIGPKQLPEVARNLGRFLNEMKRTANAFTEDMKKSVHEDRQTPAKKTDSTEVIASPSPSENSPLTAAVPQSEKKDESNHG